MADDADETDVRIVANKLTIRIMDHDELHRRLSAVPLRELDRMWQTYLSFMLNGEPLREITVTVDPPKQGE